MGERELREARRSMTKFMTIIIIALSLEAVVGIFKAAREKDFQAMLYPAAVMRSRCPPWSALVPSCFLSRRAQSEPIVGDRDTSPQG